MATVYSLICWGGRTGKSVTVNASTDLVTLTNHGLRNGKGVAFVSGTLPTVSGTALALDTTYYAKQISTSTFELYYDSALTSKIDFTSTGASLVMKSSYLLGLSDLSRWGEAGSERIYDGLTAWNTGRASASPFDAEVAELGEGYDDIISNAGLTINVPAAETTIISTVNGQRTSAFHGGALDSGFVVRRLDANGGGDTLLMDKLRSYVDGFSIRLLGSSYNPSGLKLARVLSAASRMIVMGRGGTQNGSGIAISAATSVAKHCLSVGWNTGFSVMYGQEAIGLYNNIAAKNGTGITSPGTSGVYGYYYNNISIGNTTNWGAVSGFTGASNNAGISGNSPWVSSGGTTVTVATTDFANWGSSTWATTDDYSPASISSPQVNSGTSYFGMLASDLSLYDVPAYNNGGAEYVDVGCYEFDLGYGNHPVSATISLTSIVSGSRVLITKASDGTVLYNDVPGSSLSFNTTHIGEFNVVVRKATSSPYYREFNASGTTVADQTTSIKCLQQLDE